MERLAGMCLGGCGVPQDKKKAVDLLWRASERGSVSAMVTLGSVLLIGDGIPKNEKKAFELFQRAADMGNTAAMRIIGSALLAGQFGMPQDPKKAFEILQHASKLGDFQAKVLLSKYFRDTSMSRTTSEKERIVRQLEHESQNGNRRAMFALGVCYMKGDGVAQDMKKAIQLLQRAKSSGDVFSLFLLTSLRKL